jgi:peptidylprolyl isomerase
MALKHAAAMVIGMTLASGAAPAASPDNTLIMELKNNCRVTIEMLPQVAPQHVARIKELAQKGFYDGLVFHRVIEGFMAQTGDPLGNGTGGSGKKLPAEFSKEPFVRGTVGMARSMDPNSGDSQFFIMFAPAPHLDGQYTVWGRVTDGMNCIDQIKMGDPRRNGEVAPPPDKIVRMRLASDKT